MAAIPTYPEHRTTRSGRIETLYPCYGVVHAEVVKRRILAARRHYGISAPVLRVSVAHGDLIINHGCGVRPYLLDAVLDYAHTLTY